MKWEYRAVNVLPAGSVFYDINGLLRLGGDGWELVSVDDGVAYLKRIVE